MPLRPDVLGGFLERYKSIYIIAISLAPKIRFQYCMLSSSDSSLSLSVSYKGFGTKN